MARTIFIENLSESTTEVALTELLSEHGKVISVDLVKDTAADSDTKVAFVVMQNAKHGRAVIGALAGQTVAGNELKVKAMKHGGPALGQPADKSSAAPSAGGRSRHSGVFGGKGSAYGHKGRGKGGGRSQ